MPHLDDFAATDYYVGSNETVDPRLFITVGVPGTPYMYNPSYMMNESNVWSRSGGTYGYFVSLKQNVDPAYTDIYLFNCDNQHCVPLCRRAPDARRGYDTAGSDFRGYQPH